MTEKNKMASSPEELIEEATVPELIRSLELLANEIKDIILSLPANTTIGYLWSKLALGQMNDEEDPQNHPQFEVLIFAMEYVHAVLSCFDNGGSNDLEFNEQKAARLIELADELRQATLWFCMASSVQSVANQFGEKTKDLEFHAKTTWAIIRGHRYQVLEEEFLIYVLTPHDEAIQKAYGITAAEISRGIQDITDAMRSGFMAAALKLRDEEAKTKGIRHDQDIDLVRAVETLYADNQEKSANVEQAINDLFYGGICNLSKHTKLPNTLLEDLAFSRGTNKEFFAIGEYCGTPMRTLPARIRPLVQLEDGYYATDPSFIRDSAYRAIQRGLASRLPEYKEAWNRRQKELTESAFNNIFSVQLAGAKIIPEVYYRDISTGQWVENDSLILIDDVLIQVEAKAGLMAIHSPATDFNKHVRTVQELVIKAYKQCKRFLDYASSAPSVPLYALKDGNYIEVHQLQLSNYRLVLPVGLTVESFAPFSTICKELPDIVPILGKYPFISMSIDDMFVLTKVLPASGQLFHYLEVRQEVAGIKNVVLFDELDHLGSYISKNRFDMTIKEQFAEGANLITWDGMSRSIDSYFSSDDWYNNKPPAQSLPDGLEEVLSIFELKRHSGWIKAQRFILDLSAEGREQLSSALSNFKKTIGKYPYRWFSMKGEEPLMFWLQHKNAFNLETELREKAQALALATNQQFISVFYLSLNDEGCFLDGKLIKVAQPTIMTLRLPEIEVEAEKLKKRIFPSALLSQSESKKLRPNDLCWCGSGKKYKKCHKAQDGV